MGQRPASTWARKSASAALNAAGSSILMAWPLLGMHEQGGRRAGALDEHAGQQAGPILVAGDDEHRHRKLRELVLQIEDRRALALHAELRIGRALGRMLGQHRLELGKPARVLVLELHARGAIGIGLGERGHALLLELAGDDDGLGAEFFALAALGAVAGARNQQRARAVGVGEAEMQGGKPAHGQPDDVRLVDLQAVEDRADVVAGARLRVARHAVRHVGGRPAARIEGDAAVAPREDSGLAAPSCGCRRRTRARTRSARRCRSPRSRA